MRNRTALRWLLGAVLLSGMACGGAGKPVKVSGRVTLDGQPLAGATVVFNPADGKGTIAAGRTDADGEFRLTTFGTDDGALPGDYKITVDVDKPQDLPGGVGNPMLMSEKDKAAFFKRPSPKEREAEEKKKKPDSVVPRVYQDITKTPLKQRVPSDGKVEINLQRNAK